jgi:hypothetical protein
MLSREPSKRFVDPLTAIASSQNEDADDTEQEDEARPSLSNKNTSVEAPDSDVRSYIALFSCTDT